MLIHLHADPSCPFTWITSRWLEAAVGPDDELVIRPLPLAIVNEAEDVPEPYASQQRAGLGVLRVMEAARAEQGDVAVAALYAAVGRRFHDEGRGSFDDLPEALAEAGLDPSLAEVATDAGWDPLLRESIEEAAALVGEPAGSPVLAFPREGRAFWGPVLRRAPKGAEARALLAAVATLAATPGFGQLKAALGGDLELPAGAGPV
ncbi:MAG: hypothetical protein JWM47_1140 [Acidimicrobiales bacterium]|nr:hypothetical protein [Acidimicrobiales bacterium]